MGLRAWGLIGLGLGAIASVVFASSAAVAQHDATVRTLRPLKVRIRDGVTAVDKKVRVSVRNSDLDSTTTQTVQLTVNNVDCPGAIVLAPPDFERSVPGTQDTIELRGRQTKTAVAILSIAAADFTTFNRSAPARCRLSFTADSTVPGNVDPSPSNNTMPMEINVFDGNDVEQTAVHETVMESVRLPHPGKIEIPPGSPTKDAVVRVTVVNADVGEQPGDLITVTTTDGDCPAGTVGVVDFDLQTPGQQNTVTVEGEGNARGVLPLTIVAAQFATVSARSPTRCTATITATGPGGDSDASNDVTRLVVDVIDLGDF